MSALDADSLELRAVIGFRGQVKNGLILHPDNEHLVFPLGCTIVVRNIIQRTQHFLQGHDNTISCLAVSNDGRMLASGQETHQGFNADIIIWDFEEKVEKHRLSLHKVMVGKLAFSCHDTYLASLGGQDDNSLVVWQADTGVAICGTPAANDTARCVTFAHNSETHLVTAGNLHCTNWKIDLANRKLRGSQVSMGQLKRKVACLALDTDDKTAYCGTETGDLMVVNLERNIFKMSGGNKKNFSLGITAMTVASNGDVICGTGTGLLVKYNRDCQVTKQTKADVIRGGITSITLTADETNMFVGTTESNMYWVEVDTFKCELRNTCHYDRINSVMFPRGYSGVFATSSVNDVRVWNSRTRAELLRIQVPNTECYGINFMPDGKAILTVWSDGKIRAFLPQTGRLLYVINDAHRNGATAIAATSDNGRLVSGGMEGEVRIWKLLSQTQVMEGSLKEHRGRVFSINITRDDRKAFTSSADGSCILWDLDTKTRSLCLFESTMFKSMVYHPDESQILTTGSDRKITYWDCFDGQAIRVLEGSAEGELATLSMSYSGSHFVSGSEDKTVKLWDYDSGLVSHIGVGHSGAVSGVAISPCQSFVVSVGSEGAVFVWETPAEAEEKMRDASLLEEARESPPGGA